jgi:hypothetical protein
MRGIVVLSIVVFFLVVFLHITLLFETCTRIGSRKSIDNEAFATPCTLLRESLSIEIAQSRRKGKVGKTTVKNDKTKEARTALDKVEAHLPR